MLEESMKLKSGTVYFFTGLAGAGKTTIGGLFYRRLKAIRNDVVLLDGDSIRPVYNEDIDYTEESRLKGACRTFRVAKMLADQGIDVVVCSICMYASVRAWNRENIENYREIYIKAAPETLMRRNQKGLYTAGRNVVGIDIPFDEPKMPDFVIENNGSDSPEAIVERMERMFEEMAGRNEKCMSKSRNCTDLLRTEKECAPRIYGCNIPLPVQSI